VAAALTLVVVGGLALVNALTSPSPGPAPSTVLSPTENAGDEGGSQEPSGSVKPSVVPLEITIIGRPTAVLVKEPGTAGAVLLHGQLNTGEIRRYDQVPLNVVVADSSSVQVRIYGELQRDSDGGRGEWTVSARAG
jgi:hypothetical protein